MKPRKEICIIKCGSQTPVGTDAKMTSTMVCAELKKLLRHPTESDGEGKPYVIGLCEYLDPKILDERRFINLLLPSIHEVIEPLKQDYPNNTKLDVLLGLPEPINGLDISKSVFEEVSKDLEKYFNSFHIATYTHGHSSSLIALQAAMMRLSKGDCDYCVVGGVDSYAPPEIIMELEKQNRIRWPENKWGFIPGEGSGTLLVTTIERAKKLEYPILAEVISASTEEEKIVIGDPGTCEGRGLTKAMHSTLKHLPKKHKVNEIYTDLNGERYRVDEYCYACMRNKDKLNGYSSFTAPVTCWGDLGAASIPNLINLAIYKANEGESKGPYHMFTASSDKGKRSVALLKIEQIGKE